MEIKTYTNTITFSYRDKIKIQVFSNSEQINASVNCVGSGPTNKTRKTNKSKVN